MKTIQKYTEQELVALLQQQDAAAFNYLYDNYAGALNSIVRSFIPDEQLAGSVLQDAFVKIWKQIGSYDNKQGRLFTWMSAIVRNIAIDMLRSKNWKNARQNVEFSEKNNNIEADSVFNIDAIDMRKLVNNLRDEYKMVVEMSYFYGYSQADIASQTGIPLGTIKTRLRSALIELRNRLNNK